MVVNPTCTGLYRDKNTRFKKRYEVENYYLEVFFTFKKMKHRQYIAIFGNYSSASYLAFLYEIKFHYSDTCIYELYFKRIVIRTQ